MRTRILSLTLALSVCAAGGILLVVADGRERASMDAPLTMAGELGRGTIRLAQEPVVILPQKEREIGREFLAQIPLHPDDSVETAYVNDVFAALLQPLGSTEYVFEVHTVAWTQPNAFALPGGYLVVTHGLLKLVRHEAELAAIIGHEIMHVHRGHWREALKHRVLLEKAGLEDVSALGRIAYQIVQAGFSESQELEADRGGVELAAAAGYAPRGAELAFRRFEKLHTHGDRGVHRDPARLTAELVVGALDRYFQSHPEPAHRIEGVRQALRDNPEWSRRPYYWGAWNLNARRAMRREAKSDEWAPVHHMPEP